VKSIKSILFILGRLIVTHVIMITENNFYHYLLISKIVLYIVLYHFYCLVVIIYRVAQNKMFHQTKCNFSKDRDFLTKISGFKGERFSNLEN